MSYFQLPRRSKRSASNPQARRAYPKLAQRFQRWVKGMAEFSPGGTGLARGRVRFGLARPYGTIIPRTDSQR